jgi:hypothetical protein
MEKFFINLTHLLIIIISWCLSAFTLKMYVIWFLNPIFDVKLITFSESICLILVFAFLTRNIIKEEAEPKEKTDTEKLFISGNTIIFLILGYIFYKLILN